MKVQRLRITFARGEETKYITHLDLMRFWERALRRADVPIAYSEGFSPHAQIALAAPLPVGTTSGGELMDVFLSEQMAPKAFIERVSPQLSPGLAVRAVEEVGLALPALQAEVRFAEYIVDLTDAPGVEQTKPQPVASTLVAQHGSPPEDSAPPGCGVLTRDEARARIGRFLAAETIPWQHKRQDEVRQYDIRKQVMEIALVEADGHAPMRLRMRLENDSDGSGRPEQVVAALGLPAPAHIHRTKLILNESSPVREAWRQRGRFVD